MYHDMEINALNNVYEALKGCNRNQIKRIIDWITSKFELDVETTQRDVAVSPPPAPVEVVKPDEAPEKKRPGRKPRAAALDKKDFMNYHSLKEIFRASTTKRSGAKVLLAAAYLQEKENFKELSSYIISTRLKEIKEEVKHPSPAINVLINKKPPLLLQTGKHGTSLKSRRKFRVTEEGLKVARSYIND